MNEELRTRNDFGEHIGGARKELWSSRGLDVNDLCFMNAAEKKKYVKKDSIWKKPDYDKLVNEEGKDIVLVYAIKAMRDSLPTVPYVAYNESEKMHETRQKNYVYFIKFMKNVAENINSREDFSKIMDSLEQNKMLERQSLYCVNPVNEAEGLITNKVLRAINISSYTWKKYEREVVKKQFGVKAEDKLPKGYEIHFFDRANGCMSSSNSVDKTWYITKGYVIVKDNIPTEEEAIALCKKMGKKESSAKKKFKPQELRNLVRFGSNEEDSQGITGEDFIRDFKIRGGEFGVWMNDKDAQENLNLSYDALKDFAYALGISEDKVSIDGKLALAYGARGHSSAAAHYEPEREVVNLTKKRGAGSLAHELWHAIDDIAGKKYGLGGMMTENERKAISVVRELCDTMMYKTTEISPEERQKTFDRANESFRKEVDYYFGWVPKDLQNEYESIVRKFDSANDRIYTFNADSTDVYPIFKELSDFRKSHHGHILRKEDMTRLYYFFNLVIAAKDQEQAHKRVCTDFYKNSKMMDKQYSKDSLGYWASICEMFARAGACYVSDKLKEKGCRNDYLCGHSENAICTALTKDGKVETISAVPQGEERKRINKLFDNLVEELKKDNIL